MNTDDDIDLPEWGPVHVKRVLITLQMFDGTELTVSDWQLEGMRKGDYRGCDIHGFPLDPYHTWNRGPFGEHKMSAKTDANLDVFADETGIHPVRGERLAKLDAIQAKAMELIQIAEREKSGIRDGDGNWHGSDPLSIAETDMPRLYREYTQANG